MKTRQRLGHGDSDSEAVSRSRFSRVDPGAALIRSLYTFSSKPCIKRRHHTPRILYATHNRRAPDQAHFSAGQPWPPPSALRIAREDSDSSAVDSDLAAVAPRQARPSSESRRSPSPPGYTGEGSLPYIRLSREWAIVDRHGHSHRDGRRDVTAGLGRQYRSDWHSVAPRRGRCWPGRGGIRV